MDSTKEELVLGMTSRLIVQLQRVARSGFAKGRKEQLHQ
jgi:hypothetical protein